MGDLPTANDLRNAADHIADGNLRTGGLYARLRALAAALDAGAVRLVRTDDEPPEGWVASSGWGVDRQHRWWLTTSDTARALVKPDGEWAVTTDEQRRTRAPSLRVAQYRAEAALRAAGERVP